MKLTEEQKQTVEDNHNLIYWYINMNKLDLSEYYDLLAIELCKAVISYDKEKGSLSNYYKLKCDQAMQKEYLKSKAQKRANNGLYDLSDYQCSNAINNIDDFIIMDSIHNSEYKDVILLKLKGYTQTMIAKELGISQAQVSIILKKVRKHYEKTNG